MKRRSFANRLLLACPFLFIFFAHIAAATVDPMLRIEAGQHTGPIRRLAVDSTGTRIVTVSDDKTARVWDRQTQRLLSILRVPIEPGNVGKLYGVAISPQGTEVAVGGTTGGKTLPHRIYLFNLDTGTLTDVIDARAGDIKHLAWTPDGNYLVASYAGNNGVRIFDRRGREVFADAFAGGSYGASISASGSIAVPAFDGKVRLYRFVDGSVRLINTFATPLPDPVSVSFSPDGNQLAVGYLSRLKRGVAEVSVFDIATGQMTRRFPLDGLADGNLMNVVWGGDGSAIYAGGSGYRPPARFIVKKIAWPTGTVTNIEVGPNSITDFATLADGTLAFSTFEPACGFIKDDQLVMKQVSPLFDLRGADRLRINAQGTQVSWYAMSEAGPMSFDKAVPMTFDLERRKLYQGLPADTHAAITESTNFSSTHWQNDFTPRLGGRPIKLAPGEISRAVAVLPDDSAMLLATSWSLRKLDRSGAEIWKLPVATEITAVNVSADSQLAITASTDGTFRWLRTSDGSVLMSLFAVADGRWIIWTEQGHYDASIGAEQLVGWHVNRPTAATADFYPVARFRERFYRPDVIDNVLSRKDSAKALAAANDDLRKRAGSAGNKPLGRRIRALLTALSPPSAALPPALSLRSSKLLSMQAPTLTVDFSVYTPDSKPIAAVEVKLDGRPVQPLSLSPPKLADGRAIGRITLPTPAADAIVQVFASNSFGVSEPLTVYYVWRGASSAGARLPLTKRPTLYVLAIGVSQYADAGYDLTFAAKDAADFTRSLKLQEGVFYKRVVTHVLTNQQATHQAIVAGLQWLRENVTAADIGVLFIAGHGAVDAGAYYFLPHDADVAAPDDTMVSDEQIRDALVKIRGQVLFFIDSCYSGKVANAFSKHDTTLIANKLASPESGVIVFSSSDGRQDSLEDDAWGNGAFTKELVIGLKGKADFRREGFVTFKGLDYFVTQAVQQLTNGRQIPITTVPIGFRDFAITKSLE
ncbi:MAG: caspase family protein [Gammaproteobacteria bacterium]|nr:caspase family protein [Gammaproteobacteria bacterium]